MQKSFLHVILSLATAFVLTAVAPSHAEPAKDGKHRVVFQVTADGEEHWEAVVGNLENVRTSFGQDKTEVEVVAHGKVLGLVMATNAKLQECMKTLADGGVVFAAYENTMKKKSVSKDQLLPFAVTVDSGVAQVIRKQEKAVRTSRVERTACQPLPRRW